MPTGIKESVSGLAKEFANLYKELVTNTAQFEELRNYTKETLDSFRHSLERLQDKLENYERENIKTISKLESKIDSLKDRLDMLSENALHAAARDAAVTVMEKIIKEGKPLNGETSIKKMIKDKK
jgi:uncharacterized protein Yka (UPF0111/DUF47 family)